MSDLRKAAQQALDEGEIYDSYGARWGKERIEALRAALEQGRSDVQTERKPLTEDELETSYRAIWRNLPEDFNYAAYGWIEQGIRYAEREHGIGV